MFPPRSNRRKEAGDGECRGNGSLAGVANGSSSNKEGGEQGREEWKLYCGGRGR